MIVFSAICPHPPILLPTIGKDNIDKIKDTQKAMEKLEQDLYASKPDVILLISPHGNLIPDAFSINLNNKYLADFEEFGDFEIKKEYKSSPKLVLKIKERIEDNNLPLVLSSEEKLDHGAAIPLHYLTRHLDEIKVIPLYYSLLDNQTHFEFGQLLKKELVKSEKRIAVIASGDLSHSLTKDAPAGYSPEGEKFDKELIELIKMKDYKKIIKIDETLTEKASECGLRSILILLGIIEQYNFDVEILSYQGPFGVGYLVANFKLK